MTAVAPAQNLNGAGATFPNPIYSRWFTEYSKQHSGVHINYQPIGSGGGIRQVSEGTVDFGASDLPLTDEQMQSAKTKTMLIPTVLGAVVPTYNVPGINRDLNFSADVIADIYLGKITKWNDGRIAKDNPGWRFLTRPSFRFTDRMGVGRPTSSPTTFPRSARSGRAGGQKLFGKVASGYWAEGE